LIELVDHGRDVIGIRISKGSISHGEALCLSITFIDLNKELAE
jgi:hypothetical protein